MNISLVGISPPGRMVEPVELEKKGLLFLNRKYSYALPLDSVAFVKRGGKVEMHLAAGETPVQIEAGDSERILAVPRDFVAQLAFQGVTFADRAHGDASIRLGIGLLGEVGRGREVPLVTALSRDFSADGFSKAVGELLQQTLGSAWSNLWESMTYLPQQMPDSSAVRSLNAFFAKDEVRLPLKSVAGMVCREQALVSWCAPDFDREAQAAKVATAKVAKVIQEAVVTHAQQAQALQEQEFRHQYEAREKKFKLDIDLMENQTKFQAQKLKTEAALSEVKLRKEKAEAQKAELEVTQHKEKIAKLQEEQATNDKRRDWVIEAIRNEMRAYPESLKDLVYGAVKESMSAGSAVGKNSSAPGKVSAGLAMSACWRRHDERGQIVDQNLANYVCLTTDTRLDCEVVVNRDAHVYILVEASQGGWQVMVPDLGNTNGITRSNHQKASEVVVWPGTTKEPQYGPYWYLDENPGSERFMVVASLVELDIAGVLDVNRRDAVIADIRKRADSVRGLAGIPTTAKASAKHVSPQSLSGVDFAEVQEVLGKVGDTCVMTTLVIEHV